MKRVTIGFTVVVIVMLLASVAGAEPDFCKNPDHPKCTTTQPPPTTTTTSPPQIEACPDEMTIEGKATTTFECLWKPTNDGSETGSVTISAITGAIKGPPTVFVRDESPGDICVLQPAGGWLDEDGEVQTGPNYVALFDLFYDEVPEGYEIWLGQNYWDFILEEGMEPGTHWCAPQDPVLGHRDDINGGALHLQIGVNAKKGGSFHFTLEPGNSL